jgi:hypothetical protein
LIDNSANVIGSQVTSASMTVAHVLRWWPPIGILAMVLLGVAVGKGSTPLDDWFIRTGHAHRSLSKLLIFTNDRAVVILCAVVVVAFLCRRQWRLAAVAVATPALALASEQILKQVFGREKLGGLAYPSGHVALTIVVTSMAVILLGTALWAVVAAVAINVLGLFGQAFTNHYFTDTIGAVLLATSVVCIAVRVAGLDRCQPHCDLDHSSG